MSSARKIKVLVCAYSCVSESGVKYVGGEARLGWNLVKQLDRFFEVSVLTHYQNQSAIQAMVAKEPLNNTQFFYIKLPSFLAFLEKFHKGGIQIYAYLWQIKAYFFAKKLHKKINFDVFHHITYANDWMASYVGALLPVAYIRGPGGGAHKIPESFLAEYNLREKISEKLRSFGQWMFRHDLFFILGRKKAKAILVCNQEAFQAIPKKYQSKTDFFPVNGISKSNNEPEPENKKDYFLVLTAGKLLKLKGFDLAIKAFKIFSEKAHNAKFKIVGDGPEMDNLKNLAKSQGLEDRVDFTKWMEREQLMSEMRDCDVFLFPSLRDGGGQVIVEAMGQAKPVVCFDISGPGFHIQDQWGIKIKPENPKQAIFEMAEALEKLYKNESLRFQLGRAARKRAEDFYLWDNLGEKLKAIYQKIL